MEGSEQRTCRVRRRAGPLQAIRGSGEFHGGSFVALSLVAGDFWGEVAVCSLAGLQKSCFRLFAMAARAEACSSDCPGQAFRSKKLTGFLSKGDDFLLVRRPRVQLVVFFKGLPEFMPTFPIAARKSKGANVEDLWRLRVFRQAAVVLPDRYPPKHSFVAPF